MHYYRAWEGRQPEEYVHTAGGAIIAYLIAIAVAPYVGAATRFDLFSLIVLMIITAGVTWLADLIGLGTRIPGKWEYVVIVGLSVAFYNFVATQSATPLSVVDIFTSALPKDPMTVFRGFVYGAIGGFISTLFAGLKFHGGKG